MNREELAKQLHEADRACYKDLIPAELIDVVMAASPVGNASYLAMADVAIAACADAAREAYREGAIDAFMSEQSGDDMSTRASGLAERAFAEFDRWDRSETKAKWVKSWCHKCGGSGQEAWGWQAIGGTMWRPCKRCGATGVAP